MEADSKFWDKIAPKYAQTPISDMEAYTYTLERTRSYLNPTDRVLEFGCGTGSTALLLAENVDHIIASDLSENMLAQGRIKASAQNAGNIEFHQAGLSDDSFDDQSFDVVMAFNLLHLVADIPAAMDSMAKLLKPGGILITKTPCLAEKTVPLKVRMMMWVLPLAQMFGKVPYVNSLQITEVDRAVDMAGLTIIETGNYPVSPPSHYVVARKS